MGRSQLSYVNQKGSDSIINVLLMSMRLGGFVEDIVWVPHPPRLQEWVWPNVGLARVQCSQILATLNIHFIHGILTF